MDRTAGTIELGGKSATTGSQEKTAGEDSRDRVAENKSHPERSMLTLLSS